MGFIDAIVGPVSKLLDKIAKQTFRASEIVNSLLSFSRTSGTDFVKVDVNKLVRETFSLVEHQLQKSQVVVSFQVDDGLGLVRGNSGKLQQVFLNLFLNAKDAMPGGGKLRVATMNGESVSVCVSDTGSGIAPEHIQRIYDPFFTTKTSPREGQARGTGLGLSIVQRLVKEAEGVLHVHSEIGGCTRFALYLPAWKTITYS